MDRIMLVIKGFFIGLAKIIPGVSGAVLAILFGLYDKMIYAITNFFNNKKENFYFLLYTGMGVVLAIVLGSRLVVYFLREYEFITLLFFVGLMCPSIWPITKKIRKGFSNYLLMSLGILFGFLFMFIGSNSNNLVESNETVNLVVIFLAGLVDAFASIFPGVSGTALLIFMGVYDTIMNSLSTITDFSLLSSNILVIVPFSLGMLLGFIVFAKIIDYLFKKYEEKTLSFIVGICFMSLFFLINMAFQLEYSFNELFSGLVMMILGYFISYKLDT